MTGAVEAFDDATVESSFSVGVVLGKKPVLVSFFFVVVVVVLSRDCCAAVDFMYPGCCFDLVEDALEGDVAATAVVLTGAGLK